MIHALSIRPTSLWHYLEHQLARYRTSWRATIINGLVSPVLFLGAIGFGLGSQIQDTSTLGTSDYASFVGPGVLAAAAMLQGGMLSLWPTMGALKWEGTYLAILATPLTPAELAWGHILWIGFRTLVGSSLFVAVLAGFGLASSVGAIAAPLVAALTAMAFAAPISAFAASRDNDTTFPFIARVILTPLFLFSGAFFPLSQLPAVAAWLARLAPVWHGVELARHLIVGPFTLATDTGHALYLVAWIVGGWLVAVRTFKQRLAT